MAHSGQRQSQVLATTDNGPCQACIYNVIGHLHQHDDMWISVWSDPHFTFNLVHAAALWHDPSMMSCRVWEYVSPFMTSQHRPPKANTLIKLSLCTSPVYLSILISWYLHGFIGMMSACFSWSWWWGSAPQCCHGATIHCAAALSVDWYATI